MCGISGIINFDSNFNVGQLVNMADLLKHRGPDGHGYLIGNYKTKQILSPIYNIDTPELLGKLKGRSKHNFGLAHTRLSIQDLSSNGLQPMSNANETAYICFNGEIYNFESIRSQLQKLGHIFSTLTDTEVIIKAYDEWGLKCVEKFNGMFAIAILDLATQKIHLIRDRIGIKPIYYKLTYCGIVFASETYALIKSKAVHAELDMKNMYLNFAYGIVPRPDTIFNGIKAIPPASILTLNLKTHKTKLFEYWKLNFKYRHWKNRNEITQEIEAKLSQSIEKRLIADVNVSSFLSGGIDSTLISVLAKKQKDDLKAITIGFDNVPERFNEVYEASRCAELNKIDHIVEKVKVESIFEKIKAMVRGYEEPYHSLSPNYLTSEVVSKLGIKVVLIGLGGDELFNGYFHYRIWPVIKIINKIKIIRPWMLPKRYSKYSCVRDPLDLFFLTYSIFTDKELKLLFGFELDQKAEFHDKYLKGKVFEDDLQKLSYLDFIFYLGCHHMARSDRFTMTHSIEGRFPFLDHNLVELAFSIPSHMKSTIFKTKTLLRKIAKRYIAPENIKMKKKGFSLPIQKWMENELLDFKKENLEKLITRDILSKSGIEYIIQTGDYRKIWHLVMTELWIQEYID